MDLKTTALKKLIVHYAGSKNNLDPLYLSPGELEPDDELTEALQESFLARFKNNHEYYAFQHTSALEYHEVYNYCRQLFAAPDRFTELSCNLARHLYEASTHPKVKGGEFYVAYFEGLPVESRVHRAIGLFKTENKQLFLDVQKRGAQYELQMKEGVELTRIDKGCLVIQHKEEEGYDVLIFDNQNRGEEAQYWKEKFLSVVPQQNEFHHTKHFLTLTKQFITEQLETDEKISRPEGAELLQKSIGYFQSKDSFDIEEFQSEVFGNEEMIGSFRSFGSRYTGAHDFDIASSFDISPEAVKKQSRIYKSILKLDRNFHIYIHGRTDLIERGTDMDGRKYYKIYFEEER
jgi:hypothetical protein